MRADDDEREIEERYSAMREAGDAAGCALMFLALIAIVSAVTICLVLRMFGVDI